MFSAGLSGAFQPDAAGVDLVPTSGGKGMPHGRAKPGGIIMLNLKPALGAGLAAMLFCAAGPAPAAGVADDYKGRQMRFVTMGSVGGGYDTYMRTILTHVEKKTGAKIVPVNEPAAGGIAAMNRLLAAPADGHTLLLTTGEGAAGAQLFGLKAVNYDVRKLVWLARVSGPPKIVMVGPKFPFKTFAEAVKAKHTFIWGGSGKTDGNSDYQSVLSHALGFDSRIIHGYKGSRGMNLAIEQGELDARVITAEAAARFTRSGKFRVILTLSRDRAANFPNVPTAYEVGKPSPAKAKLLDWRANLTALGRVVVAAPGTSKARTDFLRATLKQVLNDPAYLAEAKKRKLSPGYMDGDRLQKLVLETMDSLSPKEFAEAKDIILNKYYKKR
jgi:tripartite-type tricarboxylate transporter receptor subunit TctC